MIKRVFISLIIVLLSCSCVYANSAQTWFVGTDITGIVSMEESPLVVKNEDLSFSIEDAPLLYSDNVDDYYNYKSSVTAKYEIYNPSNVTIQARLLFPFGTMPSYLEYYDSATNKSYMPIDFNKYSIKVNNNDINKTIRCTYQEKDSEFKLDKALNRLSDTYLEDDFYSLDLPITKYTYILKGVNTEDGRYAKVVLKNKINKNTKYYKPDGMGYDYEEDTVLLSFSLLNNEKFEIYVIGDDDTNQIQWEIYKTIDDKQLVNGNIECINVENMTFKDLAFQYYQNTNISHSDWYNALLTKLNMYTKNKLIIDCDLDINTEIMYWYDYMIEVEPTSTIINSVTAPIYPSIDNSYETPIYSYKYLLSPAKTWKEFNTLNIDIYTSYQMIDTNLNMFNTTKDGYQVHLNSLPQQELEFKLSENKSPTKKSYKFNIMNYWSMIFPIMFVGILFVLIKNGSKKGKNC